MKLKQQLVLALLCVSFAGTSLLLLASGPAGCYAIVDRIVIEPNESAPKRIQVWGMFSLADGRYLTQHRGSVYPVIKAIAFKQFPRGDHRAATMTIDMLCIEERHQDRVTRSACFGKLRDGVL